MILSRYTVKNIDPAKVQVPAQPLFDLPEKVLQFGTGVLLRGLPDYFIDKANKQGLFNGRIVVVKSTNGGDMDAFEKQDGLYTLCVRGVEQGVKKEENIICASISRVLSARKEWDSILACAHNPDLQVIISNTTEVGIELLATDDIRKHPPVSFPGKLLAFLYERYKAFDGSPQCGMVIIPTELIVDNGTKLESIVTELAYLNGLDESFIDWLEKNNHFCNSLVDRIVPGRPEPAVQAAMERELGYTDDLLTVSECYRLWAIEADETAARVLSFAGADEGVVVTRDINLFRELKLRLLNGTHTLSCAVAFLSGFATVRSAMDDGSLKQYITAMMKEELSPSIPYPVEASTAADFATSVADRFANPHIEHPWISISVQYSSKLRMRVLPLLNRYYEQFDTVPESIALGFAAYIRFMKIDREEAGNYQASYNGAAYLVKDDKAEQLREKWMNFPASQMAVAVLQDTSLWGEDLTRFPGFAEAVQEKLDDIMNKGMAACLLNTATKKIVA